MTEGASLPGEFALAIAARVQNSADIHDPPDVFLANFHALAPHEQHLLATHWCDYEVRNGGFLQFFENSTGVLAPEAVCGFRALGLPEVAAKIEDAMNRLASSFPRNRALRRAKIRELRALLGG